MISGDSLFGDLSMQELFEVLKNSPADAALVQEHESISTTAHDLIGRLLVVDVASRLGVASSASAETGGDGAVDVMTHAFFGDIDWQRVEAKQVGAPFPLTDEVLRMS